MLVDCTCFGKKFNEHLNSFERMLKKDLNYLT